MKQAINEVGEDLTLFSKFRDLATNEVSEDLTLFSKFRDL